MASNTFTAANGLLAFDWFDALNWSAGVPVAGQEVSLTYDPGFGYAINSGSSLVGADQNPAITFGTFVLDSANATLDIATNMAFGTLDLKAGTIAGAGNFGRAPIVTGTIINEGGTLDFGKPFFFENTTWLGDLTMVSDGLHGAGTEFYGTLTVGPVPGGPRPVFTLGSLVPLPFGAPVTTLNLDHTVTGFDVALLGQAAIGNGTGGAAGSFGIAADATLRNLAGVNSLYFLNAANAGHIVVSGGTLSAGAPFFNAGAASALTNNGTIAISNGAMFQTPADVSGAGVVDIASGGTLWLSSPVQTVGLGQTIALQGTAATLVSLAFLPEASITGFGEGDRIAVYDPAGTTPTVAYAAGVLTIGVGAAISQFYIGPGYDPASFSAAVSDTTTFGNGNSMAVVATSTVAPPAASPYVPPAPGGNGGAGPDSFTASLGLFNFDWNAAGNWSSVVPGSTVDASITFSPGWTYRINAGSTLTAPSLNPAFTFNTLTLDAPGATLAVNADMHFGTLDLKSGIFSPQSGPAAGNLPPSPSVSGTIINDGGTFDFTHGGNWSGVTWVGDLAIGAFRGVQVLSGGLTIEAGAGQTRPAVSVPQSAGLSYYYPTTVTGFDVALAGGQLNFSTALDSPSQFGNGTIAADVSIHTTGTSSITAYGFSHFLRGQIVNDGTIQVEGGEFGFGGGSGGDSLGADLTNNGTITATNGGVVNIPIPTTGTGAFHIASGGVLFLQSTIGTGQSITLDDAGTSVWINTATVNTFIHGFQQGDTIAIAALSTADIASVTYSSGVLTVKTGVGTKQIPIGPGYDPTSFHVTVRQDFNSLWNAPRAEVTTTSALPCFAAGTRIRTLRGEVAVERLRVGDVVPGPDGEGQAIIWLGHRSLACARHPRPQDVWPVRVRAGAFGEGLPARDLRLSPDHAVFVDGVLIPVRYLVNGATIVQERAARVTYWHVEFARHGVMLAEGLACESYLDTGNRGAFANGGAVVHQHPDFALAIWSAAACAPLVRDGATLERVRAMLAGRAEMLGFRCAPGWDGTVNVDGLPVAPRMVAGTLHRYALPDGAHAVRLLSPAGVPAEIAAGSADHRRLGLMLEAAVLRGAGWQRPIDLAALPDGAGFHDPETDGTRHWRWTDGDARLPVGHDGPCVLDLVIGQVQPAWVPPPMLRRAG